MLFIMICKQKNAIKSILYQMGYHTSFSIHSLCMYIKFLDVNCSESGLETNWINAFKCCQIMFHLMIGWIYNQKTGLIVLRGMPSFLKYMISY